MDKYKDKLGDYKNTFLSPPSRVILEITNKCNLDCNICLRQSWNGSPGSMSEEVFSKLLSDFREYPSPPDVFFGGYGEPLNHPNILDMIRQVSDIGSQSTLITNGTLLTPQLVESLVEAGLRKLWISVDSSHYDALLLLAGEAQISILDNLAEILHSEILKLEKLDPGLVFVLTRKNKTEIMNQIDQGLDLGLRSFFITNLEAYSPTLGEEVPYRLRELRQPGLWHRTNSALIEMLDNISVKHPGILIEGILTNPISRCPFAERGILVFRWDGEISPCLPLLYDRTTYIESWEHRQFSYSLGNIMDLSTREIWTGSDYSSLCKRLLNNEFSPCLGCRDCWFSEDNVQDCMGFEHPTCGGCLWAEGLISCP